MLLPLKLICERKNVRRDGTSLIYIQYCFSADKRTLLNTQISIPPLYWNKRKSCISYDLPLLHGDVQQLNDELKRMYRIAEDIVAFAFKKKIEDPLNFVKKTYHPHFDVSTLEKQEAVTELVGAIMQKKVNKDFYFQMDDYIEAKRNKVCNGMLNVYRQLKERIKAFETFRKTPISFESMDYTFYEDFIEFLTFHYEHKRRKQVLLGLKVNTLGQTIKQLRIFLKDRIRRKIISPIDLTDFKIPEEETDAIYLTFDDISKIYKTNYLVFLT